MLLFLFSFCSPQQRYFRVPGHLRKYKTPEGEKKSPGLLKRPVDSMDFRVTFNFIALVLFCFVFLIKNAAAVRISRPGTLCNAFAFDEEFS